IEALSDVLRYEVGGFGIDVIVIEPGLIRTGFGETAAGGVGVEDGPYGAYNRAVAERTRGAYEGPTGRLGGDAQSVARVIEDAILSHFAADAVLIVQTDHAVFTGADEIRRMFTDFCAHSVSIFHEIKNIVVEPDAGKIATEQSYIGELVDGAKNDMHNCNFFDINADGQFTRVIIWMAGTNPLK